jgi:hypothetical protein
VFPNQKQMKKYQASHVGWMYSGNLNAKHFNKRYQLHIKVYQVYLFRKFMRSLVTTILRIGGYSAQKCLTPPAHFFGYLATWQRLFVVGEYDQPQKHSDIQI